MALGRRPISCLRPAGAYDADGIWQESAGSPFIIDGSIQPLRGRALESLPEGRRAGTNYRIYTDFRLQTVDDKNGKNPDRLTFRLRQFDTTEPLRTYEVISVEDWQSGIVSHYKAIVSLLEQTPDGVAEA